MMDDFVHLRLNLILNLNLNRMSTLISVGVTFWFPVTGSGTGSDTGSDTGSGTDTGTDTGTVTADPWYTNEDLIPKNASTRIEFPLLRMIPLTTNSINILLYIKLFLLR